MSILLDFALVDDLFSTNNASKPTILCSIAKIAVYNITMLNFTTTITELIHQRFSCRSYLREPIHIGKREQLQAFIEMLPPGPFGARPRFDLAAATESDKKSLRGLGTYGFIKNPPAFILGAMTPSNYGLEDYGYLMEAVILYATSLGLGTCWLGGTFTKSSFARKMKLSGAESMPAVTSVGEYADPEHQRQGLVSHTASADRRLPWEKLFFNFMFEVPLLRNEAAEYATALEMVRLGPSASNKQPWRILNYNEFWRFYLRRTPGYREDPLKRILDLCDLQRLDMGIAMCHFELTAKELGLKGEWVVEDELDQYPDALTTYVASWKSQE